MGEQERIRILELAWELVRAKRPSTPGNTTEASIKVWHELFDQAYKAIMKLLSRLPKAVMSLG